MLEPEVELLPCPWCSAMLPDCNEQHLTPGTARSTLAQKVLETVEAQKDFYEAQRQCDSADENHEFAHYYTVARNIASEIDTALRELFQREGIEVESVNGADVEDRALVEGVVARLREFLNGDDYALIARHFIDQKKDRDITGDVEALLERLR